ncbi:MAG: hypothetical protein JW951_03445 [Lentisphaerae bacterium]|nr:hypothetical protein [Lentisphaerota bacterium]
MTLIADTHVHLYPGYDLPAALAGLARRLGRLAPGACPAAFLAEARGCAAFDRLRQAGLPGGGGWSVECGAEPEALRLVPPGAAQAASRGAAGLYLFAGRQVVTAERLEILALTLGGGVPDGQPAAAAVQAVLDAGGVPAVSWSPGKWFGRRGARVRELVTRFGGALLMADTSLRPLGWPEPGLMRLGRAHGAQVVAGSDPLPAPAEIRWLGRYASFWDGPFDTGAPVASARRLLRSGPGAAVTRGRRCGPAAAAWRWARHALGRGAAAGEAGRRA